MGSKHHKIRRNRSVEPWFDRSLSVIIYFAWICKLIGCSGSKSSKNNNFIFIIKTAVFISRQGLEAGISKLSDSTNRNKILVSFLAKVQSGRLRFTFAWPSSFISLGRPLWTWFVFLTPFLIAYAFDTLPSVIQKTKTKNLIRITSSSLETKKHIKISSTSGWNGTSGRTTKSKV